jgi:hypothetical protein
VTIILGYIYLSLAILQLLLLTFNYSFSNWIALPKNKNTYLQSEFFFVFINGFILFNSSPLNWIIGLVMLGHAYGAYTLLFNSKEFYTSLEEIKAMTSQDNILDLISIPTFAIIGFIVIYSPSLTGGI